MMKNDTISSSPAVPALSMRLARGPQDLLAAQRLRYQVFGEELGAELPHARLGIDRDRFDRWCDHLLVRNEQSGQVIGTYRILPSRRAERTGGFYCDTEFDTRRLQALGSNVIEVGRACIHPDHRTGAALAMLWAGLAQYIKATNTRYVLGCASIAVDPDPAATAALCHRLLASHASAAAWRVTPFKPFALEESEARPTALPPLLRGYLRMGAQVCGPPAYDPAFRTADLLVLLAVERMNARYAERLFRAA